jgi:protein-S-isoprenylcysteine O-methyltransferase Ste14
MPSSIILIMLATLIFAVIHSLLATQSIKQRCYAHNISQQRYRLLYVATAILLTGLWLAFIFTLPDRALYHLDGIAEISAVSLQGLALLILWLSLRPIDVAAFLGLRPFPDGIEPFIERGIYRHIRHPMYSGLILLQAAAPVQTCNSLTLLGAVTVYFVIGARFEERRLLAGHPAYGDYRRRVPAFIPGTGPRR